MFVAPNTVTQQVEKTSERSQDIQQWTVEKSVKVLPNGRTFTFDLIL